MNWIPVVLHPITSSDFLQFLVEQHTGPTLLIICTSRDNFIQQLLHCIQTTPREDHQADAISETATASQPPEDEPPQQQPPTQTNPPHPLLTPTLSLLSRSRSTTLAFCPSLKSLHAYLSTLRSPSSSSPSPSPSPLGPQSQPPASTTTSRETKKPQSRASAPVLALLNPINLHRGTAEFSAQGLSRTFAAAVEAAKRTGRGLVVAECKCADAKAGLDARGEDGKEDGGEGDGEGEGQGRDGEGSRGGDVWEEEVSILNVATKRFGAGERGWVGRTVRVRRVVERWCVFEGVEGCGVWGG